MVIYPDLITLRGFYSYYIQKNIKEKNQIVQIASFYETDESVRQTLSLGHRAIKDIENLEKEKGLIIVDSLEKYLKNEDVESIYESNIELVELAKSSNKVGISILGDLGAFIFENKIKELVDYELFLPTEYKNINLKGICLYHEDDFKRLTEEQRQKLVDHHGKSIEIKS
ncbi:MAG: hypothetical protein ACTHKF_09375 [Candidatus Nitrosocosmicus sp.]